MENYTKTTWVDGDVISSQKLNNIETGLDAVSQEAINLKEDINNITTATASAIDKALSPKTVSNGKVTEWQFKSISGGSGADVNWVTPEDYGAVGDGVTDDSAAVQDAVDAGYAVYFGSNKTYYLASEVSVDHDCYLYGGENATIKTKTPTGGTVNRGLAIEGTKRFSTTLTTDYVSDGTSDNSSNRLTLANMTGIEIGDVLVVMATDQYYAYSRQYYYLGATLEVTDIYGGYIYVNTNMPFDIELTENVTVDVYSAPVVKIENLKFESDLDSFGTYNFLVDFRYCKNPSVINCTFSNFVMGLQFRYCVNVLVDCVNLSKSKYDNNIQGDGYGLEISSCTNTNITRIVSLCSQGCIDLTGNIPNIDTFITKCDLASEARPIGIDLHENNYNLVVEDCVLGGLSATGTVTVNRCRFYRNNRVGTADTAITYRGSHNADWATLKVTNCDFEHEGVILTCPVYQTGIESINHVIGRVVISDCINGDLNINIPTNTDILSNTINEIVLSNWKNAEEVYKPDTTVIKKMTVTDCVFTHLLWMNDHNNAHGVVLNKVEELIYQNSSPLMNKRLVDRSTYGERQLLPEGLSIQLSSSNNSAKFLVCGANLTPNLLDDYTVGSISGTVGQKLTRSAYTGSNVTLSVDADGNPVYTQGSNTSRYSFYPIGMFYVGETSDVTISATIKNTGVTNAESWYAYIAVVDCNTGLLTYRNSSDAVEATAAGASITHTRTVMGNSVVLCYFFVATAVSGAVTKFEDMSIQCVPKFAPFVVDEPYNAKRRTGDGTIISLSGINNIMSSEETFSVKFGADYVNNPIGVLTNGSGVSF